MKTSYLSLSLVGFGLLAIGIGSALYRSHSTARDQVASASQTAADPSRPDPTLRQSRVGAMSQLPAIVSRAIRRQDR